MTTTTRTARIVSGTTLRATGWDDFRDLLRAGHASEFAMCLTTTALGGGASYTQTGVDRFLSTTVPDADELGVFVVDRVRGLVWADQAGTLYLEESDNNSAWTEVTNVSVSASTATKLPWSTITKKFFRFRYVNGGSAQTAFRLYQMIGSGGLQDVTIPDGKDEALGSKADTAASSDTGTFSLIALFKRLLSVGSALRTLAKGGTAAGNPTSTAVDANTQALDVSVKGTPTVSVSGSLPGFTATPSVYDEAAYSETQVANALAIPAGAYAYAGTPILASRYTRWSFYAEPDIACSYLTLLYKCKDANQANVFDASQQTHTAALRGQVTGTRVTPYVQPRIKNDDAAQRTFNGWLWLFNS